MNETRQLTEEEKKARKREQYAKSKRRRREINKQRSSEPQKSTPSSTFQIFQFGGNRIRTVTDVNGKSYFWGEEIARALGYSHPSRSISQVAQESKRTSYENLRKSLSPEDRRIIELSKIRSNTVFVTEDAARRSIARSSMPNAQEFADWINEEVAPNVRQADGRRTELDEETQRVLRLLEKEREDKRKAIQEKERIAKLMEIETAEKQVAVKKAELAEHEKRIANKNAELAERERKKTAEELESRDETIKLMELEREEDDRRTEDAINSILPRVVPTPKRRRLDPHVAVLSKDTKVGSEFPLYVVRGQKGYVEKRVDGLLNDRYPEGRLVHLSPDPNPVATLNRLAEEERIQKKGNEVSGPTSVFEKKWDWLDKFAFRPRPRYPRKATEEKPE